jgi:poly(A) polymerase
MPTTSAPATALSELLTAADVAGSLWAAIDSGVMDGLVPELAALRMEQDPIHRHKDVLAHTVAVVAKTPDDLIVRLAALFHDIAKPRTRSFEHGGVTFRHHEVVGSRMARKRLAELGYPDDTVNDVSELVRLSGRFKGYADGWSDAAIRRYARDAGPLLGRLNALIRSDSTTRNQAKADALQALIDDFERRIAELAEEDRRAAERPQIDGATVMAHLGLEPGPEVGRIMRWLLELKRAEGELAEPELLERLDSYWENLPGRHS